MFTKLYWNDVKEYLSTHTPELYEVLNHLAACFKLQNIHPYFYQKNYQFGESIVKDGVLAEEQQNIPEDLQYAFVPLAIITSNAVEVFEQETSAKKETLYPLRVLYPGDFIGLFETLDYLHNQETNLKGSWSLAAGARSIAFMNNTDSNEFRTQLLRGLGKRPNLISKDELSTPWHVVKFLMGLYHPDWQVQVLFFPAFWFSPVLNTDHDMQYWQNRLNTLLLAQGWSSTSMLRSQADKGQFFKEWERINSPLVGRIGSVYRNIGFDLYMIGINGLPCMVRSEGNEQLGPFETIKETLVQHINNFNPVILLPGYLGNNGNKEGFFSLRLSPHRFSAKSFTWGDNNLLFFDTLLRLKKQMNFEKFKLEDLLIINAPNYSSRFWSQTIADTIKDIEMESTDLTATNNPDERIKTLFSNIKSSLPLGLNEYQVHDQEQSKRIVSSCLSSTFFQSCIYLKQTLLTKAAPLAQLPLLQNIKHHIKHQYLTSHCISPTTALVCHQHILPTTATLLETLKDFLFYPENIFLLGKPYSTITDIEQFYSKAAINIFPFSDEPQPGYYDEFMNRHFDNIWNEVLKTHNRKNFKKIIILDEGGGLRSSIPDSLKKECGIIAVEQTTSGALLSNQSSIPTILVALSAAKRCFESPVIASAIYERLQKEFIKYPRMTIGIIGLGFLGMQLAKLFHFHGYAVFYYDKNTNNDKFTKTKSINELITQSDMILGCTGVDVIDPATNFNAVNGHKILVSCSSRDIEFNTLLRNHPIQQDNTIYHNITMKPNNNLHLTLLNGGFPINFDRTREWEAPEDIQLTRSLLLAGLAQACKMENNILNTVNIMLDGKLQRSIITKWLELTHNHHELKQLEKDLSWWQQKSGGT